MTIKVDKIVKYFEILIVYACLFPNVSFGLNSMDSQPWVLLLLLVYFSFKLKFEKNNIFILWVITILVMSISVIYLVNESIIFFDHLIRALSNYTIVFFVWSFSISIHKKYNLINHYIFASWIYILYGFMQLNGFLYLDWISNNRTTAIRGVTSFAAEPTYFSIILLFLSWLILNSSNKIQKENKRFFSIQNISYFTIFINIISIFLLAKSSTVILLLIVISIVSIFMFMSRKLLKILIFFSLTIIPIIFFNFQSLDKRVRPIQLASEFYDHGFNATKFIMKNDASVNGRVAQVFIPYIGMYENYGLPGGHFTFEQVSNKVISSGSLFWSEYGITAKIQSFIGVFVYELGFIGLVILFSIALILKKENNWKWREIIILFITLIPSVPLGYGLIPLLFGSKVKKNINKL